jgi:uncharacterized membrane protein
VALLVPLATGMAVSQLAFADTTPTPAPDSITLSTDFPSIKDAEGGLFTFTVNMAYVGTTPRVFDLSAQFPAGASAQIVNSNSVQITAIRIDPTVFSSSFVTVNFSPKSNGGPDPGQYAMTFSAKSGSLNASIQLTAVVTARYEMHLVPANSMFSTNITAGQDNHFGMIVQNNSSVALDNVTLTMAAPDGWNVRFVPDKIASIPAKSTVNVDAVITPPSNTIAGDYDINGTLGQKNGSDFQKIRVTVQTPTVWGWVGILIVVGVIAGLGVIFRQLGRR